MEIKIGNSTEYLIISNIVPEGQELGYQSKKVDFLRGTLELKAKGVTSAIRASFIMGEIERFKRDLQLLYDTLKHTFVFENFEGNIYLKFKPESNGQITMDGYLRNEDYTVRIEFTIVTDQTFLPATINQIKEVLN